MTNSLNIDIVLLEWECWAVELIGSSGILLVDN